MTSPSTRSTAAVLLMAMVGVLACDRRYGTEPVATQGAGRAAATGFLKGQLHLHSNRSGDSDTPAAEVVEWYRSHGYDFIVFTDHNRISDTDDPEGMLTLPGVELTQNLRSCEPPPGPGHACLLHVDALLVTAPASDALLSWPEPAPTRRVELYGRAVAKALELGGLAQLNHPNFQFGADVEVLLEVARRGAVLVEIANMAVDSRNDGDDRHPSTEALWDAALGRGAKLFATATDDAHHYGDAERARARGETAYVGDLGWVMVRASKDPASIRAALARGDFYASTGLTFSRLELGRESMAIELADPSADAVWEVIGEGGRVVSRTAGARLAFDPRSAAGKYLRVRASAPDGRRAWTQPVWLGP